jgi:hypothetical protein
VGCAVWFCVLWIDKHDDFWTIPYWVGQGYLEISFAWSERTYAPDAPEKLGMDVFIVGPILLLMLHCNPGECC